MGEARRKWAAGARRRRARGGEGPDLFRATGSYLSQMPGCLR